MNIRLTAVLVTLLALVLGACATGPRFDTGTYSQSPTPAEAALDAELWQGSNVLWSGVILNSVNHEDGTELEVLGYPLAGGQRPDTARSPIGRFIVFKDEYLETVDYDEGRMITVAGEFVETRRGLVGEARFTYPVVAADDLYLWARDGGARRDPQFSIGIGVLLGR